MGNSMFDFSQKVWHFPIAMLDEVMQRVRSVLLRRYGRSTIQGSAKIGVSVYVVDHPRGRVSAPAFVV